MEELMEGKKLKIEELISAILLFVMASIAFVNVIFLLPLLKKLLSISLYGLQCWALLLPLKKELTWEW